MTSGVREYLYTPLAAEVLSLFMPENYKIARLVWLLVEHASAYLLFIFSAILVVHVYSAAPTSAFAVSALLLVAYSAVERSFFYGQMSLLLATLMYFSLWLFYVGRSYLAAFLAAFAAVLKLYPLVLLVALLVKGRFRHAFAMSAFLVLIPIIFSMLFGIEDWLRFFQFHGDSPLVDRDGSTTKAIRHLYEVPNYSPVALLFLLSDQFGWHWTQLEIWRVVIVLVLLISGTFFLLAFRRLRDDIGLLQLVGLGVCGIMLISPLQWNHTFIFLLPIYVLVLYRVIFDVACPPRLMLFVFFSFALVAFPDFLINLDFTNNGAMVLLKYTKLYGLIFLASLLLFSRLGTNWADTRSGDSSFR